ncbi:Rho GTPase-activating protein 21 [Mortierella antarctica]|nr:Rho GTPase-activating protein 21 [Mortierella antarctica]
MDTCERPHKMIRITKSKKTLSQKAGAVPKSFSSPSAPMAAPVRQASADETMLQSQMLGLGLSEEELHALELNQLPSENIQRKGSLRVKSQKVSSNATISSWKDYWVVIYKGFLLFYRDEGGLIKSALSLKSSADSLNKVKHVTQVKPSGCFDAEKVAVELPVNGLAMTKKKNFFYITPGSSVRLLLQDASGGDEKAWFKDIQTSLASRKADELSGSDEPYLIQLLKRQTASGGEVSGLKMNKKIEEKDSKTHKGPLKMDKARGIRSMVAHGIHVPRRKSAQDERLKLPADDECSNSHAGNIDTTQHGESVQRPSTSRPTFTVPTRKSSRDQSKDLSSTFKRDQDGSIGALTERSEDMGGSPGSGSHHGAKTKLSNMSRNFFSKDKDKDKEKEKDREKEKEKGKDREKDKGKYKIMDKYKHKDLKKQGLVKSPSDGSQVFGGSLVVETGRTVPRVVELCIHAIEARGLSVAGIYRVSGHMGSIQNIKRAFNEGSDHLDKMIDKEPDINTIAALLKLYFRELREPLMLFEFYPSFIAAADIDDYNEKLYTIKSLVHSLPEPNFSTLQYLMMHLGRVQDQYHTTKMDSANLAICFAPNLLRQQVDDMTSIINTGKQSSIIDTLIEQREWIFDPYPEEDEDEDEEEDERAQDDIDEENRLREHHDEHEDVPAHPSSLAPHQEEYQDAVDESSEAFEASPQPPPPPPRAAPDDAQGPPSDNGPHPLDHQQDSSQRAHRHPHPSYAS